MIRIAVEIRTDWLAIQSLIKTRAQQKEELLGSLTIIPSQPSSLPEKPQEVKRKEGFFAQKPVVDSKAVEKVLKLVVEGEQEEADKLLKEKPELLLASGKVTDLSGRTFESITAFQYAVWALDWHMWKMLLKHLPKEAAAEQLAHLEEKGTAHGKQTTQIEALINALEFYIENGPKWKWDKRADEYWQKTVGGAQRLLPVHVVNEYCRADRSFDRTPTFLEDVLPRTRKTDEGEWFTGRFNGGVLGQKFAVLRGKEACATAEWYWGILRGRGMRASPGFDNKSLQSLIKTRAQQKEELVAFLKTPSGPSAGGSQRDSQN